MHWLLLYLQILIYQPNQAFKSPLIINCLRVFGTSISTIYRYSSIILKHCSRLSEMCLHSWWPNGPLALKIGRLVPKLGGSGPLDQLEFFTLTIRYNR